MIYRFADCVVDTKKGQLQRGGQPINIAPKVFDVLVHLLEQRGELVSREALLARHWPRLYITEGSLTTHIGRMRQAIGHSSQHKLIETVHKKGYRFVAEVIIEQPDHESTSITTKTESAKISPGTLSVAAERRQLTVLCCQQVSEYKQADDVEIQYQHKQQLRQWCLECFTPLGGHLAQSLPDTLVFYFGYPQAFEDNVQRALLAALRLLEQLQPPMPDSDSLDTPILQVRIGIHSGPAIVETTASETASVPMSSDTTQPLAQRLCEQAKPQSVVISAASACLIREDLPWQPLSSLPVGAQEQTLLGYQVTSEHRHLLEHLVRPHQGETPFVGREPELALLEHYWATACEGMGKVICINGDPGIGKSRLLACFQDRIDAASYRHLICHCSPYHQNSAWFPLLERLRSELQQQTVTPSADDLEHLEVFVKQNGLSAAETVPLLAALLSIVLPTGRYPALTLSPQQQRQHSVQILLNWLLAQAQIQPLLLSIEDLHWADPSTLEFIERLIQQVAMVPILVVLTARPEFEPSWDRSAPMIPIQLTRLNHGQIQQMLWRIAGGKALPVEIIDQIQEKTDGVPLFIEELTRMLIASGQLLETEHGFELAAEFDPLSIPQTLEDSLQARLDQLDSGKFIAHWGSVLGREFSHELLAAVIPLEESLLQQGLNELLSTGLLYRKGLPPHTRYFFKHALIRDSAYQSLLKRQRQDIHRKLAQTLEAQFPIIVAEQPELLARHYTQAGLALAAIPYWAQAGENASERWAHEEAIEHLTSGLRLLDSLSDTPEQARQELAMQINLGASLIAIRGPTDQAVKQCFERAKQLCQRLQDASQLFPTLANLWRFHQSGLQYRNAQQIGQEMLTEARRQNDPQQLLTAYQALGASLYFQGELTLGGSYLQQSLDLANQLAPTDVDTRYSLDPRLQCLGYLIGPLQYSGYPDQAREITRQLLELIEQRQHPHSLALSLHFIGLFHINREELVKAQHYTDAVIKLANEHHFPYFQSIGGLMQGWLMAAQGQGESGVALMRQNLAEHEKNGRRLGTTSWRFHLAEACGMAGVPDDGLQLLAEAATLMEQTGERFFEPALALQRGVLLQQQASPDIPQAEACLQQSLVIARQQQAKWWELRAAIILAELWRDQGKPNEAHQWLTPVYEWFTEGFNTVYLQRAKVLLEQLQN